MSFLKDLVHYGAPVAGAALGSIGGGALGFSPAIAGAVGGGLGGVLGNEFGGKGGIGGDLLEGGLGAAGGYFAGPSLASLTGTTPGPEAAGSGGLDDLLKNIGTGSAAEASIPAIGASAAPGVATGALGAGAAGGAAAGGLGGIGDFFSKNPALLAGGVGLGAQLIGGSSTPAAETALNKNAKLLGQQGTAGVNGQITPSAQIALNDAITSIKSSYANSGLSGSTMEAQEIQAATERAIATSSQQGLQELGLSNDLYSSILGYEQKNDQQLSDAISNLMSSIGYGQGAKAQGAG